MGVYFGVGVVGLAGTYGFLILILRCGLYLEELCETLNLVIMDCMEGFVWTLVGEHVTLNSRES